MGLLKSKGAQKIRASTRPDYGYIPKLLKKWGFEITEESGKRVLLSASKLAASDYSKPDYIYELDLKEEKHLAKFKKAYLKARTEVTEENFDQTMETFKERDLTISCILAKKDELLSYGLLYKGDRPERCFMSSIPVFNADHAYILKDIFDFLVNKAKEKGHEEIYHILVNEENENLYKDMGIEFTPSHRYELNLE